MRTRSVLASVALLLVVASCMACGGGGGGGSSDEAGGNAGPASTADVAITWRATDPNVAGYVVHWGAAPGAYSHDVDFAKPMADAEGTVTVVIAVPIAGVESSAYYFAISSYDVLGGTSSLSNELSIDVSTLG